MRSFILTVALFLAGLFGLSTYLKIDVYQTALDQMGNLLPSGPVTKLYNVSAISWRFKPVSKFDALISGAVEIEKKDSDALPVKYTFSYPGDFDKAAYPGPNVNNLKPPNAGVTPIVWSSCLSSDSTFPLSFNGFRSPYTHTSHYNVCRLRPVGNIGPDVLIGIIWPPKNHQPSEHVTETCIRESIVWFEHIGDETTEIAICLAVTDVEREIFDVKVIERSNNQLKFLHSGEVLDNQLALSNRNGTPKRYAGTLQLFPAMDAKSRGYSKSA